MNSGEKEILKLIKELIDSKDRLEQLLSNTIIFFDTGILQHLDLDEKVEMFKNEMGFTEEEIRQYLN